jgi:hypothetical protein
MFVIRPVAAFFRSFIHTTTELPTPKNELKIVSRDWTGWTRQQPTPFVTIISLTENVQEISLPKHGTYPDYTLTVIVFSNDFVQLYVENLGLKQGKAALKRRGMNLKGCTPKSFTMGFNETIKLYTCTMDGGTIWTITYN